MHASLCICALVPRLVTRTRVVLFVHRAEDRKSTNTGRLAGRCLVNSEVIVRGHTTDEAPRYTPAPGSEPLLLFPHEGAAPLDEVFDAAARAHLRDGSDPAPTLLVPDGTWRQASKVKKRVPGLEGVRCVTLPRGAPSIYRLRVEAHDTGVSTIEAIARALGILEGDAVERALLYPFRAMVERTLWSKGDLDEADVTGGIPAGVQRHDPRGGLRGSSSPAPAPPRARCPSPA
jgi:DTW domain-containing protein YfiP